ncbi:hypothetical protein [Cellulomonas sp. JZ18]|uniref:hypothetical protein n=1 Tax=Cellulomonas sp. JZ18 TaxID=2654191 RepID=UPI001E416A08|nr:hypothetical protein [Cellulomonas sp. JZ18]
MSAAQVGPVEAAVARPAWWRREGVRVWGGVALAVVLLVGVAPAVLSDFRLNLLAKFLCLAMVAVGIGLAWGAAGCSCSGRACSSASAATSWRCT